MFVVERGAATSDADALDQVLFHLGSSIDKVQTARIVGFLEDGKALRAAELLASVAAAKQRALSGEDRDILRRIIQAHQGDLTHIRVLDALGAPL